jgi:exopolyphosphatase/guanosine-5'-triphosphate,3'-diphosphate pyrophosphatase
MVVFKGLTRNPEILFNERVLCGLGRSVSNTGTMDEEAMDLAIATLQRFTLLCGDMKVDDIRAVATSAVRDAENGEEFITRAERDCQFPIKVLTGEEEADLSASGAISGFPSATGIVGDLGGGSLELIYVKDGEKLDRITLPIGPLRLLGKKDFDTENHIRLIKEAIESVQFLKSGEDLPFYLIGGAWRGFAQMHMEEVSWPLPVTQAYTIAPRDALKFSDKIANMDVLDIYLYRNAPKRRVKLMPLASRILEEVVTNISPSEIIFSAYGIREGILYENLSKEVQNHDPLIAACKDIADRTGRFPEHAIKLMNWMDPVFEAVSETKEDTRLRFAACLLSDISWRGHPDFRSEKAAFEALHGRFAGIDHLGRAQLAISLFTCYGGVKHKYISKIRKMINGPRLKQAERVGYALRLGQRLTGGTSKPLTRTRFEFDNNCLRLLVPEIIKELAGKSVLSRMNTLAKHMDVDYEVVVMPDA